MKIPPSFEQMIFLLEYTNIVLLEIESRNLDFDLSDRLESEGFGNHVYETFNVNFHDLTDKYLQESAEDVVDCLIEEYEFENEV